MFLIRDLQQHCQITAYFFVMIKTLLTSFLIKTKIIDRKFTIEKIMKMRVTLARQGNRKNKKLN